ncbi:alpha/beta hydrolase, partial [Hungatella sp.]
MKKDQSKIHLLGNKNGKRILLIHGMGFNWKNCFDKVLHILGKDYYFIIPELPGHSASSSGAVTSVILSADYISTALLKKGINYVDTVYGISLGASIALELALKGDIRIKKLILDGGQYESMGNMKYIY